ncbi:hypothetical protein SAMN05421819_1090 [Bryocella elongata]|uniref:Uncharacterized protein n=1 Tax=Bryocella elongata TaxID=863522 RepID=A0A1H5UM15_9BACT|nr:hypothetical protein SAMN05421819_1090 [Bryocella elongata]
MRKLLAIALLFVFSFPLIAPAFGLGADSDSRLPVCCRRHGAHHCTMSAEEEQALSHGQHFSAYRGRCSQYPQVIAQVHLGSFLPGRTPSHVALASIRVEPIRQVEAWARAALEGARHKRGPPDRLA